MEQTHPAMMMVCGEIDHVGFVAARCRVDCRWVEPSSGWEWAWWSELFATVIALVPREDRDPADRVFPDTGQAQLRTAIARACKAAGVPPVLAA